MYVPHTKATSLCFCIPLQSRTSKSHVRWQKHDKTKHIFHYSNHRRWFLIILLSFTISVLVNYARSNCHATKFMIVVFTRTLSFMGFFSPAFKKNHPPLNLSGEKASDSEAGLGPNPHCAAVFTETGVNSRAVQASTSGLINNDRRVMMWWSTGAQKYYTAGHHRDTKCRSLLSPELPISLSWQRSSGSNISGSQ